jgi:hypothetical protein
MTIPKKYLQDRAIVLLLSLNTLLAVISSLSTLFSLNGSQSEGFIAEYRSNLGLSAFRPGDASTFIAFMVFVLLILGFHTLMSIRVYRLHRQFSLVILSMGTLLIVLAGIVSNALLGLR